MNSKLVFDFLKIHRRIISTENLDELIYRVCAHTGLPYDSSKEVICLIFEEMINAILSKIKVKLSFGTFYKQKKHNNITFKALKSIKMELENG